MVCRGTNNLGGGHFQKSITAHFWHRLPWPDLNRLNWSEFNVIRKKYHLEKKMHPNASVLQIRCGAIEPIFIRLPEVTTNKLKKSSKEKSRGQKLL